MVEQIQKTIIDFRFPIIQLKYVNEDQVNVVLRKRDKTLVVMLKPVDLVFLREKIKRFFYLEKSNRYNKKRKVLKKYSKLLNKKELVV